MATYTTFVCPHPFRALTQKLILLFAGCWLLVGVAQGAVITVTNENDAGLGSLRQAISDATSGDEIKFGENVSKIVLTSGSLVVIGKNLTVTGPGASSLTIDGGGQFLVVDLVGLRTGGETIISGLTITRGVGGLRNRRGKTTLRKVLVTLNTSSGIINNLRANLTLEDTIVSRNTGGQLGGGIVPKGGGIFNVGILELTSNSIVKDNSVALGWGGGIYNQSSLSVNNSSVLDNLAKHGGGIFHDDGFKLNLSGATIKDNSADTGGGIVSFLGLGTNIINSTISLNSARLKGGGLRLEQRVSVISTISGSTISFNKVSNGPGGGIHNERGSVSVLGSTFEANQATADGGAIRNGVGGSITVDTSTIRGNKVIPINGVSWGGGIWNAGTMTITKSTISENSVVGTGGGLSNNGGLLTLTNSTVSGNAANSGGGMTNDALIVGGSTTLNFSTVTDNTNGGIQNNGGTVRLSTTIVGKQRAGRDCAGIITSNGLNLDSDGFCQLNQLTDLTAPDPRLGVLQNNGGPTFTHALLEGSPAIDSVDLSSCFLPTDQRSVDRPSGPRLLCDRGAFEFVERITLKVEDGFGRPMIDGVVPPPTPSREATIEPVFIDLEGNVIKTGTFSLNGGTETSFDGTISASGLSTGEQTVTGRINPSFAFTWEILTSTEAIEEVIADVEEQRLDPELDPKISRRLEKAVKKLSKALEELDKYKISKALKTMRRAARELLRTKKKGVVISDALGFLVDTARQLALDMIAEAEKNAGTKKVDALIKKAQEELGKAQREWNKGRADKAIDRARKAWENAHKATRL